MRTRRRHRDPARARRGGRGRRALRPHRLRRVRRLRQARLEGNLGRQVPARPPRMGTYVRVFDMGGRVDMATREEAGRPLELLEREISELAAHIHAATCRWLLLVGEYDRREGWAEWGCKSCAQWLSWRCSLAPSAAREQVRVARQLAELPLIAAAFGRGELSYSQVRALSRVA